MIRGFPPIADGHARVLVLGTLPSEKSLAAGEYYAHPQNRFWRIMGELFGFDPGIPYRERTGHLVAAGVALWDVCEAAHRPGSLDASIRAGSEKPNDFARFLAEHRAIRLICFNGKKAEELFERKVRDLPEALRAVQMKTLPSTSPAHASMRYEDKLGRWSVINTASNSGS